MRKLLGSRSLYCCAIPTQGGRQGSREPKARNVAQGFLNVMGLVPVFSQVFTAEPKVDPLVMCVVS